jgi:hypothetical protein
MECSIWGLIGIGTSFIIGFYVFYLIVKTWFYINWLHNKLNLSLEDFINNRGHLCWTSFNDQYDIETRLSRLERKRKLR